MEFNKYVLDKLELIFQKHKLTVTEQFNNYVKLESDKVVLTITHDIRENANLLYIGKTADTLYLIDGNIIKRFFIPDLEQFFKIPELTVEDFVNNLVIFFEGEGRLLLEGNSDVLNTIEKYVLMKSKEYTTELLYKQSLDAANKAWEEGNYKDFIKYLDKMDKQKLPSSYELKYKMAQQGRI